MKKAWIHKANSFKEAESFDEKYYFSIGSSKRLDMMQFLREQYAKIKGQLRNESRKRLRRSVKIIQ
jgi:hypothetical protein